MVVGRKKVDPAAGQTGVVPPLLDGRCFSRQEGRRGSQGPFPEPLGGGKERIHVQHPRRCPARRAQPPNHGALPAPARAQPGSKEGKEAGSGRGQPGRRDPHAVTFLWLFCTPAVVGILLLLLMSVLLGPIISPFQHADDLGDACFPRRQTLISLSTEAGVA